MESRNKSPFKFLDSYSQEDKNIFFGRDEEIDELHYRVFKSRILLIFGVSGVGKTSLIKCGLANRFENSDWFPIHIRRGDHLCRSLIREAEKSAITEIPGIATLPVAEVMESIYLDYFKPIYLIFDQFEEIFIFGNRAERMEFIAAIKGLIDSKIQCRLIFSIREEYLAKLAEFEEEIPDFLSNRIRINPMTHRKAREVIEKSCRSHEISLEQECQDAILQELFPGETEVDLAYLQIFLDRLYQEAVAGQPETTRVAFTGELIRKVGNVRDILGSFLEDEIRKLEDPELARGILKSFVSAKGTKQPATEAEILEEVRSAGLDAGIEKVQEIIRKFISIRIIRDQDENGKYELRHDSLAAKINEQITLPEKELKEIRHFIRNEYETFIKRNVLLSQEDLKYLEPYLPKLFLKPDEQDFVSRSKKIAGQKKLRRRKLILASALTFVVCLTGLTIWALLEGVQARKAARIARSNETASFSLLNLDKDPTLSFRLSERAYGTYRSHLAMEALSLAYETSSYDPFYVEMRGHRADVYCMDFTPHGNRIVTGSFDSTARTWDCQGKELAVLKGHKGRIFSTKFSPDGRWILTASLDGSVRLWDLQGKQLAVIDDPGLVNYLADFSPDGHSLITAATNGTAAIWSLDFQSMKCTREHLLSGHSAAVISIHVSQGAPYIATTSRDNTARIWDYSGKCLAVLKGHNGPIRDLSFSPGNATVVTASDDGTLRIWDMQGKQVKCLTDHTGGITRCDYTPDGKYLVSISDDGTVLLHSPDGTLVNRLQPHTGSLNRLALSPDSRLVAIGADNGISQVWSVGGTLLYELKRHMASVREIRFAGNNDTLITTSADGLAKIWMLKNAEVETREINVKRILAFLGDPSTGNLVVLDGKEALAVAGLNDNRVSSFGYQSPGMVAAVSADRRFVLTGSYDNTARLWDLSGHEILKLAHTHPVKSVEFSPDDQYILTSCNDGAARIWDRTGRMIREFKRDNDLLNCASFSPDGTRILTGSANFTVTIWNRTDGSIIETLGGHAAEITAARYSPDGTYLLTTSKDGVAMLREPTGRLIKVLGKSHRTAIEDIGFCRGSEYFYTLSRNPTMIQIWTRAGELENIINLGDATGREHYAQFKGDGNSLVVMTATAGRIYTRIWPLSPEQLISNVNQRQLFGRIRQLTAGELKEFYLDK
ncbi:MAG TPA: hypothetical protein PKG48_05545 [Bacteroidales bacterium]|nr:hypothetical protein [Bacteroidales bacterium]